MTGSLIFAVLALLVCPSAYLALCLRMHSSQVARPPYVAFFFVFGTLGGWLLAFAFSPSGLAASSIIFLITLTPLALIVSSAWLTARPERSRYHRIALWSGFVYPGLLVLSVLAGLIFGR